MRLEVLPKEAIPETPGCAVKQARLLGLQRGIRHHVVHESLDQKLTSYTIANEGRRIIGCDRVSVAIRKGRKCVIEAISGQDFAIVRSMVFLGAALYIASNVVIDLAYTWADPRVRLM